MLCGNTIIIRDEATNDNRSSAAKSNHFKKEISISGMGWVGGRYI